MRGLKIVHIITTQSRHNGWYKHQRQQVNGLIWWNYSFCSVTLGQIALESSELHQYIQRECLKKCRLEACPRTARHLPEHRIATAEAGRVLVCLYKAIKRGGRRGERERVCVCVCERERERVKIVRKGARPYTYLVLF